MSELSCYQVEESGIWRRFGSSERFNRVLYGGHNSDQDVKRFFTFAGDTPIFMGAMSDYLKNTWCYQAKLGVLQSGLALTPGVTDLSADLGAHDNYSRWFHTASDVVSSWRHGYMEYELAHFSPWFPETRTRLEVYPLQEHDGFLVHYDILADGEVIFCAALGGITDFIGRFDSPETENREFRRCDCDGNRASQSDGIGRITDAAGTVTLWAGNDFGATLEVDASAAALEKYPSLALPPHAGEPAILKFVRHLAPGERLTGNLVVLAGGDGQTLQNYLAADPRAAIAAAIQNKTRGIVMTTPDRRLDTVINDQQIALDASYHRPTFFHGAVGYHAPFLGWRGWYAPTLAGWFDRVRGAVEAHLGTQVHAAGAEKVWYDGADRPDLDHEGTQYHHLENSAGKLTALLHRDDIYDMQEVAVDMIFHYLERTGDLELGAKIFDALAAVLAWEERILDPDGDGLYQNFLNTWISDGHVYNGGGCAQASFYNYAANFEMVRLGDRLGRDTAVFAARAAHIRQALHEKLWLEQDGIFAEYIDTVGSQLVHPSPELSTLYLASESGAATAEEVVRGLAFSEHAIRNILTMNRRGRLAYSANWLPKKYSTCGIFPAENAALALAYFRCFRKIEALRILDGLLDAFALSHSPGAVAHVLTAHASNDDGDWDFTDVTSTFLRLTVEGLWGVRFRRLSGQVEIAPQLPDAWAQAELRLVDLSIQFRRDENGRTHWVVDTPLAEAKRITLPGAAHSIRVNGVAAATSAYNCAGVALRSLELRGAGRFEIEFEADTPAAAPAALRTEMRVRPQGAAVPEKFEHIDCTKFFNVEINALFDRQFRSPRPAGYSIGARRNGRYAWEWTHYGHNAVKLDDTRLRQAPGGIFRLDSGWSFPTPAAGCNAAAISIWENFPTQLEIPLDGRARELVMFLFGATNAMQNSVVNAAADVIYGDGTTARLKLVHPENFDDLLVPALQQTFERFYWSDGAHGMVIRMPLDPAQELTGLRLTAVANEVIVGLLGAALVR